MNAVEIEEAVSELAAEPFEMAEFPFAFLRAFGNKDVTIKRLRSGSASDVPGGVLQRNNVHLAVCDEGDVATTLTALRASPKTTANRVKFVLATDGIELQAHDMAADDPLACPFTDLGRHFGFFLPLAGMSTVRQIKDNPIDVKATGRLNKLYVELLRENPDWGTEARRPELNRFMARLIFCFFAEDTGIFLNALFSKTVEQMSDSRSTNTHEVLAELFRAMATPVPRQGFRLWADTFPFVNGGLFSNAGEVPRFSRMARTYLLRAAELSWREINPDIFGSMIQAVADDDERGSLGLHYTSVPNILKVLKPLFLDSLREQLDAAGDSVRKLRALRRRIAAIRVFDPACGSGNFLVIAYIRMREIEDEIVRRTGDEPKSVIPLTNFYGIEIKGFAAEIARLALLIAEYQCDARLISQQVARSMVLPLHRTGQIHTDNALRTDWLAVCPPTTKFATEEYDLGGPTGRLALEDNGFSEAAGAETYICGNPPYFGGKLQSEQQKGDLECAFRDRSDRWPSLDYVAGWFLKASEYIRRTEAIAGLVSTNSICQGQQIPILWPLILQDGVQIAFAHTSFRWANLATRKAVVTVVIVGLSASGGTRSAHLYELTTGGSTIDRQVSNINPYLIPGPNIIVEPSSIPLNGLHQMVFGNMPRDDGNLLLTREEKQQLEERVPGARRFLRLFQGSEDFIEGKFRACIWIGEEERDEANRIPDLARRMDAVAQARRNMKAASTQKYADKPYRFVQIQGSAQTHALLVPRHSSEARPYLPVGLVDSNVIVADSALAIYDSPIWSLAIICSRLHLVWIATVCGKIKTDFRYSNTIGWNTFPVPPLTAIQKAELTRCAEDILLAREAHFPATIADLYDAQTMPDDLRHAHDRNDEVLERIYVGRLFRNDTERLEKLFDLYTRMTHRQQLRAKPERKRQVA